MTKTSPPLTEYLDSHALILDAYLSRLSLAQLEKLVEAQRKCWLAQNNNSTTTQMMLQDQAKVVASDAIKTILLSDLNYPNFLIKRHANDVMWK